MVKEEIKAFKPIINSMKLIRDYCREKDHCYDCIFFRRGCAFGIPEIWNCEYAIAALEVEEATDDE